MLVIKSALTSAAESATQFHAKPVKQEVKCSSKSRLMLGTCDVMILFTEEMCRRVDLRPLVQLPSLTAHDLLAQFAGPCNNGDRK